MMNVYHNFQNPAYVGQQVQHYLTGQQVQAANHQAYLQQLAQEKSSGFWGGIGNVLSDVSAKISNDQRSPSRKLPEAATRDRQHAVCLNVTRNGPSSSKARPGHPRRFRVKYGPPVPRMVRRRAGHRQILGRAGGRASQSASLAASACS